MRPVTVIIPTTATPAREAVLHRAVNSVLAQRGVEPTILVAANGAVDAGVIHRLACRPVRIVCCPVPGLSAAIAHAVGMVDTEFFAELDDDDELLPDALALRLDRFAPDVDVVVTAFIRSVGGVHEVIRVGPAVQGDPLRAMTQEAWLAAGSGLYRTNAIDAHYFRAMPAGLEWTYLGYCLALHHSIHFLDVPTLLYHADTPGSLSKLPAHVFQQPAALRQVLALPLPGPILRLVRRKYAAALHQASELEYKAGHGRAAWDWHLRSLMTRYWWRYFAYTRWLLPRSVD
jgi:glycosyltransferase involved in cell wall biosynthesis